MEKVEESEKKWEEERSKIMEAIEKVKTECAELQA